jgi:hypothetical protein
VYHRQQRSFVQNTGYFLYELALYYLIYAEGANLRHMAELLWFIFWICRNSKRFQDVRPLAARHPSTLFAML